MKKGAQYKLTCRNLSFLMLILVLVMSPCGIKQSLKQIFNVENLSSHRVKANASCQYISVSEVKESQQREIKRQDFAKVSGQQFLGQALELSSNTVDFPRPRSVPLYILYQQLRSSIV